MKKFLRILCYSLLGIVILLIVLVLFLFFHYNSLEKKVIATDNSLRAQEGRVILAEKATNKDNVLNIIPLPQKVKFTGGSFTFPQSVTFSCPESVKDTVGRFLSENQRFKSHYLASGGIITFRHNGGIPVQGYNMEIARGRISIDYSTARGLLYSIVSLKVLDRNYSGRIPCVSIEDYPDLKVRGLMFDISRNKIPTRETLLKLAGLLSDLKFNHMELYVEGFSFAYPSFRELWENTETPMTGDDIKALDKFCKEHFIDLVPNQNMFGHMMSWLATDRFKDLAECPKGFKMMGILDMKGTLDPSDPRSIELVTKMADDILPSFSSENFNVNLDEPFDLGKGKSKKLCEEKGEGNVYFDYALKIHDITTARNKKMLMWGDIILKYPEILTRIPRDITLLDWGYEALYPFEKNAKALQSAGVSFMVCPGTSSWSSIVGRTDNMIQNIKNSVTAGVKHGASGMILTDWGDMGHWQYLPVSYAGYAVGAGLSWNSKSENNIPLASFLSAYLFRDEAGLMGSLALNLGRYPLYEEKPGLSMTWTNLSMQIGLRDEVLFSTVYDKMLKGITVLMQGIAPELVSELIDQSTNRHTFNYKGMYELIDSAEMILPAVMLKGDDSILIRDEYQNALRLLRLGTDLQYYYQNRRNLPEKKQKELLTEMKETGTKYLKENKRLWMIRNKPGGYDTSVSKLVILMKEIEDRLQLLERPAFTRSLNRFMEKVTTAAAVIYIKNA
jgi:hexosaminidase